MKAITYNRRVAMLIYLHLDDKTPLKWYVFVNTNKMPAKTQLLSISQLYIPL